MRLVLLLIPLVLATRAQALTWPTGPAPCNNIASLQACVDGAVSGDVIEIAANAIPAQTVNIPASFTPPKSLTLRPAVGFTPVFADFSQIIAVGGDVNVTIVIQGLTITRGRITAVQAGEGTFDLTIRGNKILNTASFGGAIEIRSGNTQPPYGPTLFRVENNQIDINVGPTDTVSAISTGGFQGGVNVGTIARNVIRQNGGGQSPAIGIANGEPTLQVDVISNQISGSNFNSGVSVFQFAPSGQTTARIINNTITGQVSQAGAPFGISLSVSQGSAGFTVVNNTVAYNERGLYIGGRPDLGATASALIANNIVAFNTQSGLTISDFDATVTNRSNLVFGNAGDFFSPGPGTVFGDPRFVSTSNFRLRKGSAARDAGDNASVPADITTDVLGVPRIRDGVVDIGAFEDGEDVLLLNNQCSGSSAHLPAALADLGIAALQTPSSSAFELALASGTSWDLVLVDHYSDAMTESLRTSIRGYIAAGGRIYMNSWNWDATTAASFGAVLGTQREIPPALSPWIPGHPTVSDPEPVGANSATLNTCSTDATGFDPAAGALAVAGFSPTPTSGEAALIVANGGRTVLLGTTPGLYPAATMLPLLRNVIRFLQSPDVLLLDAQCGGSTSHFPTALADLELPFVLTTTGAKFDDWFASGIDWRLVIVDGYGAAPSDPAALAAYVQGGGRAWWSSSAGDGAVAAAFEASLGAPYTTPVAVRRWNGACCGPQHPVYRAPGVALVQTPTQNTCSTDGYPLGVLGQGMALSGSTLVPTPGQAALVAGNHGRTLYSGPNPGLFPAAEMVPFLRSAVEFLLSGAPLYTVEAFSPVLRTIDATTAQTHAAVGIELGATPVGGGNGLALDPQTGALFGVVSGGSGRDLVRIHPDTGAASLVGTLTHNYSGLAFDCRGDLFGVTGDGDQTAPEQLFALDTQNGAETFVTALGNGDSGEAIAFNLSDGRLYHGSGRNEKAFESLDANLAITPVALSGESFEEFRGLAPGDATRLLLTDGVGLFDLTTNGVVSLRAPLDHRAKGLANSDARCCSDPGDADCDGGPNAQDLCPFYFEQDPAADADGNGRGDECECGDQNGDGRVDVSDLVAINLAIFNPGLATPLCDANGDGLCNVNDIVAANVEIFSPGKTSTCARQPVPGP